MPQAAILTLDQCYASTAAGFADILNVANSHLRLAQAPVSAYFHWDFVSAAGGPITASNGLPLQTHPLDTRQHYDLVFVPSVFYGGSREFDHFSHSKRGQVSGCCSNGRQGPGWRPIAPVRLFLHKQAC